MEVQNRALEDESPNMVTFRFHDYGRRRESMENLSISDTFSLSNAMFNASIA